MKRSSDETARARYEDALRHEGRAGAVRASSARHSSRRPEQPEPPEHSDLDHELRSGRGSSRSRFENRLEGRPERRSSSSGDVEAEAENPGAVRLAESRRRAAQHKMRAATLLMVIPTTLASITLMAMAHVVFRDWRSYESEASIARAQLNGLQEQLEVGQRRLKVLRSAKGREQILAEHGFIRPGDRLLLFPKETTPESHSSRAQNDIAAQRGAIRNAASSSAWERAARSVTGWLGSASSSPTPTPSVAPSTSASPIAASQAAPSSQEEEAVSPEDRIVTPREEAAENAAEAAAEDAAR